MRAITSATIFRWAPATTMLLVTVGCQLFVDDADRQVYRLIDKRQQQAVGVRHDARIDQERVPVQPGSTAYEFVPNSVTPGLPDSFATHELDPDATTHPSIDALPSATSAPTSAPTSVPANAMFAASAPDEVDVEMSARNNVTSAAHMLALRVTYGPTLTLSQALTWAFVHSREFQEAKEDLYLAALALTLERHMWTPRLIGDIKSQYANYGEIRDWDHAMDMVATVGVEQKLPYGGKLTAQVVNSLMRDLTNHVTTGESGQALLKAEIPLLKGAGPAAFEPRYRAERQLIYAVRAFERFRRGLAVDIATDYFTLQQLRQAIVNSGENIDGSHQLAGRARAMWKAGRATILDVQRAEQDELNATNDRLNTIELYQAALDTFKIRIGIPPERQITIELPTGFAAISPTAATQPTTTTQPAATTQFAVSTQPTTTTQPAATASAPAADIESQTLVNALAAPAVDEAEAIRVALKYRLDLINELDRVGDAERGVAIAENGLLPQLDFWGSVQYNTDPDQLGAFKYYADRATYRAGAKLELPLDRTAERNQLRQSLILKRRAERDYEQAKDTVVQQVRRAMRRIAEQRQLLQIQAKNRLLARHRLAAAKFKFQKALVGALEVVDAQNALLKAQNGLAQAQAAYKTAVLQFWRDTDTLRIAEDGKWEFALATDADSR